MNNFDLTPERMNDILERLKAVIKTPLTERYINTLKERLALGAISVTEFEQYSNYPALFDSGTLDEARRTACEALKAMDIPALAGLYLVFDQGWDIHKICLFKDAMSMATDSTLRHLSSRMMHNAVEHGIPNAHKLALDYDAYQSEAETWYAQVHAITFAKFGEAGALPFAERIDPDDALEHSKNLRAEYEAHEAKLANTLQDG